jgi:hypothetical protein
VLCASDEASESWPLLLLIAKKSAKLRKEKIRAFLKYFFNLKAPRLPNAPGKTVFGAALMSDFL